MPEEKGIEGTGVDTGTTFPDNTAKRCQGLDSGSFSGVSQTRPVLDLLTHHRQSSSQPAALDTGRTCYKPTGNGRHCVPGPVLSALHDPVRADASFLSNLSSLLQVTEVVTQWGNLFSEFLFI